MSLASGEFFVLTALFTLVIVGVFSILEVNVKRISTEIEIPPPEDAACMARYIVHNSNRDVNQKEERLNYTTCERYHFFIDWCSMSYISKKDNSTLDTPLSRVFSISDGVPENGTGVVYFMVSPLDLTIQDLMVQNNCSIIMTLAQSHYCMMQKYDPQDPRCGQVILNGNFVQIQNETDPEYNFAKNVLWTRHPIMKFWFTFVRSHKWFFAKMKIRHIAVVDFFGGRKFPNVSDYYNTTCDRYLKKIETNLEYRKMMSQIGRGKYSRDQKTNKYKRAAFDYLTKSKKNDIDKLLKALDEELEKNSTDKQSSDQKTEKYKREAPEYYGNVETNPRKIKKKQLLQDDANSESTVFQKNEFNSLDVQKQEQKQSEELMNITEEEPDGKKKKSIKKYKSPEMKKWKIKENGKIWKNAEANETFKKEAPAEKKKSDRGTDQSLIYSA